MIRASALCVALLAGAGAPAGAAMYFVDPQSGTCSATGPGTEASPYCTISGAAAAHHAAADTIVVKPGVYREQVTVPGSGAAGAPFVIQAQGPGVHIDGADAFDDPTLWAASTGTVFVSPSVTWGPNQVFVDDDRLTPSTLEPASLPAMAFTWVSGEGLYVNLGGDSPGDRATLVGRRRFGFNMFMKSWVVIDGFEIAHTEERGIYVQNSCTDVVVAHNRVSFAGSYGIQTVGGARIVFDTNVVSDCNLHGIGLISGANGCVIRYNESFRNADPAVRRANGIYQFGSPNNTLYGNRLHDNQDTGMQFSSGSNDCISYNNQSWNNGDHGYDHLHSSGTIHVNDLAYGNYKDGFSIEGNSPNTSLANCIAVDNGLTTNEFDLWVDDLSAVGFVSDHNIFWNSTSQNPIKYITTKYAKLAEYRSASGQDGHSYQADPRFVNGPAGDFRVMPGSPAIDAANSGVPNWPATDAAGNPRNDDPATANHGAGPVRYADIGVLEFDIPPVVKAHAIKTGTENKELSISVKASDGQAIASLTANLGGLPAGNNAQFTTNSSKTSGTLRWTPTYADSGTYVVIFTASNALSGSDTTTIRVTNVDRKPVVSAPTNVTSPPNDILTFTVTASDPDGDPIQSLVMVPVTMPSNHGATFVANPTRTAGTFTWTIGARTGTFKVRFDARNALTGTATTIIEVTATAGSSPLADGTQSEEARSEGAVVVTELAFSNGFPNPSRGDIEFALDLPEAANVRWAVFDLQGRTVWSQRRAFAAGRMRLRWDGTTTRGAPTPNGIYLVRASVGGVHFTRRVIRF